MIPEHRRPEDTYQYWKTLATVYAKKYHEACDHLYDESHCATLIDSSDMLEYIQKSFRLDVTIDIHTKTAKIRCKPMNDCNDSTECESVFPRTEEKLNELVRISFPRQRSYSENDIRLL